jgi:hypothetical protein
MTFFSHTQAERTVDGPKANSVRRSRGQIDTEPCKDFSHGLTRIDSDKSERLAAHRTGGKADCRMTSTAGGLSSERRIRTLWIKTALGMRLQANYLRHAQPEAVRALVA